MSEGDLPEEVEPGALEELPIFPLPDVVLFPGAVLPLHVFEPRYREMISDALDGHRLIAMARIVPSEIELPEPGELEMDGDLDEDEAPRIAGTDVGTDPGAAVDERGSPEVCSISGLGTIIANQQTDDGRYYLLLRGIGRVRIEHELPLSRPYRRVRASLLDDNSTTRPEAVSGADQQLVALVDRLSMALQGAGELSNLVREIELPGRRADAVSAALISEPDERQRLLEMLDPADRLDAVIELIARATAKLTQNRDLLN
ncbi:MAG TPA: LON peptidase substrate-binding domain-containing protein [Kofleriaceae bacterium]|nr:LON peptidase substrate-binding domain-containing protein [Kofleriaceae bacterium]